METSKSPRADYRNFKYDKPLLERLRETHGLNTPAAHAMLEAADEIERLRLELDMVQATILVPSQKDDRRTIERLRAELVSALNDAALLREAVKEAKDAEHQRWVKALLKVLPEEKAVLFREICVAAAMGEAE